MLPDANPSVKIGSGTPAVWKSFASEAAVSGSSSTAKFGNGLLATQPIKDNADLFFC
jgi:hypothetical protein